MKIYKSSEVLHNYEEASKHEWLETNGIGGYASATLTGANTRRYHGLLIAARKPPVDRVALVSKLEETLIINNARFDLGSNQYKDAIYPQGYQYLSGFTKYLFPEWIYKLPGDIELKKTIAAVQGENTTLVIYELTEAPSGVVLELCPLISGRDFHSITHVNTAVNPVVHFSHSVLRAKPYHELQDIFIKVPEAEFSYDANWYYNFEYLVELNRGQEFREDLFSYGKFARKLNKGDRIGIIISVEDPHDKDGLALFETEKKRRLALTNECINDTEALLILAADQFVVSREENLKSLIAGYHWFSDWGRDTMISLPGICLSTRRYEDAKKILKAFAHSVNEGMLPNRFPDHGEAPEYNTADATLWFFIAIHKYMESSGDKAFVLEELLPVLGMIIEWHIKGTRFNIHTDTDGFLFQGVPTQQLTWMDARIGDWVVTPRIGKAVEINALWYNALIIYAELLTESGDKLQSRIYKQQATGLKDKFLEMFWNESAECLYDYINGDYKDPAVRPNQLFALSLPYPLITGIKAKSILRIITNQLYTPVGIRSLSPLHPDYKGRYGKSQLERDSAYHQGTAWSWLLGPYMEALIKVNGLKGKKEAQQIINNIVSHLNEVCAGSISEIFDGDAPHAAQGCIAQAWSVAELLRIITDYKMSDVT